MPRKDAVLGGVAALPYWREEEARVVVDAWRGSALSLARFAERHGLHPRRVARWAERLGRNENEAVRFHRVRLVEAREGERPGEGRIEVVLHDGCTVRVPRGLDSKDLRQVLDVLAGRA